MAPIEKLTAVLVIFSCTAQVVVSVPTLRTHTIYVDRLDGTENQTCWTGDIDLPCRSLKLAEQGRRYLQGLFKVSIYDIINGTTVNTSLSLSWPANQDENCPPWMYRKANGSKCECAATDHLATAVECNQTENKVSLLLCYCMTYSEEEGLVLGKCLSGCTHKSADTRIAFRRLPTNISELNDFMCGDFNRTGRLCGQCKKGLSPLVYSYEMQCVNCTNMYYNWAKYTAAAFIPLTAFFLFVVLFKFNGTSPQLHAVIVLCQGLGSPINARPNLMLAKRNTDSLIFIKILATLYGIWNLDFFRTLLPPICLNITPLQAIALDYVVAMYPLGLIVITYAVIQLYARDCRILVCLWKPFRRYTTGYHNVQSSVINAFATFLLLSYVKILDVSTELLVFDDVYYMNGTIKGKFLYYDASIEYFSREHLPYATLALFISLIFTFLPLLLLLLYPMSCFQKCLNCTRILRQRQTLDSFVDSFQGYYKDGTEGTRDCRYFSITYFIARVGTFAVFSITKNAYCYSMLNIILIGIGIITILINPYKKKFDVYNKVDPIIIILFALILSTFLSVEEAHFKSPGYVKFSYFLLAIVAVVPVVYFIALALWWICVRKESGKRCLKFFKSPVKPSVAEPSLTEWTNDRLINPDNYAQNSLNNCSNYGSISAN